LNENYPSASQVVRNLADLRTPSTTLHEEGKFRIVELESPFFGGYRYWVVNEKGFMWEPGENYESALEYLKSAEAIEYQNS
jgi:hypothetical protein